MLKQLRKSNLILLFSAAFGRLCVETKILTGVCLSSASAAFGRLCVETFKNGGLFPAVGQPPSGGCVLKQNRVPIFFHIIFSRLRAAVC